MGKDNFNPGPRLIEKEIERLVGDMYADGKSPMEFFGIDWATTIDLSVKVEVAEGKILSAQTLPREDYNADLPKT